MGAVGLIATLCGTLPLPLGGSLPAVLTTAGVSAALAIGGAALLIAAGLWKRRFAAGAAELLARYGAERPEDILGRASAYREACVVAAEAAKKREAVEQALAAQAAGADYLGVGAMFPTGTKQDTRPVSYDTLKAICAAVDIPVVAIGGIGAGNVAELAGSGIAGVAVVSALYAQPDVEAATRSLRAQVERVVGP